MPQIRSNTRTPSTVPTAFTNSTSQVVLGEERQGIPPMRTNHTGDSNDVLVGYPVIPTPTARTRKQRLRPSSARTVSNSTITGGPGSPNDVENFEGDSFQSRGHQRTTSKDSRRFPTRVSGSGKESHSAALPETLEGKTSTEFPRPLLPGSIESRSNYLRNYP